MLCRLVKRHLQWGKGKTERNRGEKGRKTKRNLERKKEGRKGGREGRREDSRREEGGKQAGGYMTDLENSQWEGLPCPRMSGNQ